VLARRDVPPLEKLAGEVRASGARGVVPCDVTDEAAGGSRWSAARAAA